ncbi:MAG: cell division protein FtsZ [Gammaproteobacteria bacterium]|nr:cell division protein FtsZ [Gammaproteobacteria bacterium]
MFELMDTTNQNAVIKVIGVGGGGGNAVRHMASCGIEGVEFICANTDAQALRSASVRTALQIGCNITKGLGAGADPDVGRQAAMEDRDRIIEVIDGADMLFITAGLGGGTGTGAAPVVAQVAKELGILTVAVVTKPFRMEGRKRMTAAEQGIHDLGKYVDSLITIPNEKLLTVLGAQVTLLDAFRAANEVLQGAVQGIAELITRPGLINVDFADVRTVMGEMGMAMMGSGTATGPDRAREAAEAAISSPLLEEVNLSGARGILVNVTAGMDLAIGEFHQVGETVKQCASDDATVVVGTVIDPEMSDSIRVTVVATGLGRPETVRQPEVTPMRVVSRAPVMPAAAAAPEPVQQNYGVYEQPPLRRRAVNESPVAAGPVAEANFDMLDIPAFLRRQAD